MAALTVLWISTGIQPRTSWCVQPSLQTLVTAISSRTSERPRTRVLNWLSMQWSLTRRTSVWISTSMYLTTRTASRIWLVKVHGRAATGVVQPSLSTKTSVSRRAAVLASSGVTRPTVSILFMMQQQEQAISFSSAQVSGLWLMA